MGLNPECKSIENNWLAPDATVITSIGRNIHPPYYQPVLLEGISLEQIDVLHDLSLPNRLLLESKLAFIDSRLQTMSNMNLKDYQEVFQKIRRSSFSGKYPGRGIAAIYDYLRAKTVLQSIEQTIPVVERLMVNSDIQIVKCDTTKMIKPDDWGWRCASFDLLMPNKQIIEYYLVIKEIQWAKRGRAHADYEKWRNHKSASIANEQLLTDQRLSSQAYSQAWQDYLSRVNLTEPKAIMLWNLIEMQLLRSFGLTLNEGKLV